MNWFKKNLFQLLIVFVVLVFHKPFFINGRLPIPSDTIVGMYHPFRDNVKSTFASGVPFKNPLITDPVRQQFIWRDMAIRQIKSGELPVWNPYSFSGTPLHANFQSAVFYPMNLLYFLIPHKIAWSWQIVFSQLMCSIFLFYFLKNNKLSELSSLIGSLAFSFSGFAVSWLEWNTMLHVASWVILSLFSIDKIIKNENNKQILWFFVFTFSIISAFLAGHLQLFFYGFLLIFAYFLFRLNSLKKEKLKVFFAFTLCFALFVIITLPQSVPTLNFIKESSRDVDQGQWTKEGWFIPWQNLIQFIVPDFFGNPATGNYFGVWNYAEFVGFIGTLPLIMSLFALFFSNGFFKLFFGSVFFMTLIFALPSPIAKIPYILNLPLISTSQPSRLLFLIDLSLSILAAIGFDYFYKNNNLKKFSAVIIPIIALFVGLWLFTSNPVSRRNLILPSIAFLVISSLSIIFILINKGKFFLSRKNLIVNTVVILMVFLTVLESLRFSWKFTPFTEKEWLFPETQITKTLKKDKSAWRMISLDRRVMPPNFSGFYGFQDVAGYDPLYLKKYNILVSSWNTGRPEKIPGAFNRIVTPDNLDSFIVNLLNTKYVLSYGPQEYEHLDFILSEGETYLYQNKNFFPRAWLVGRIIKVENESYELDKIFELKNELKNTAVTSENINFKLGGTDEDDRIEITSWSGNKIIIKTKTKTPKILVLSEIDNNAWNAKIDGKKADIIRVDYLLRGLVLDKGEHTVEFYTKII